MHSHANLASIAVLVVTMACVSPATMAQNGPATPDPVTAPSPTSDRSPDQLEPDSVLIAETSPTSAFEGAAVSIVDLSLERDALQRKIQALAERLAGAAP